MFHEIALVVCLGTAVYSVAIEVAPPRPHNFQPRVALLKPTGFSVTISDTADIEDVQLLGNVNVLYNVTDPYSSAKVKGFMANIYEDINTQDTLSISIPELELKDGDIFYYWLLICGFAVYDRYAIHNLSFAVKEIDGELSLYNFTTDYVVFTYTKNKSLIHW